MNRSLFFHKFHSFFPTTSHIIAISSVPNFRIGSGSDQPKIRTRPDPIRIRKKLSRDPVIRSRRSFFCWIELVVLVTTKKDRRNRIGRSRDNRKKRFFHSRSILVTPYHGSIRSEHYSKGLDSVKSEDRPQAFFYMANIVPLLGTIRPKQLVYSNKL